jgi:predicted phage-related endonuclease
VDRVVLAVIIRTGREANVLQGDGDDVFRAQHVGASEVAALFDCSPWLTHFELWHRRAGNIATPDFAGDERMRWGVLLEPIIVAEACERYGWEPVETPKRLSNGKGLGGHPDQYVRRLSDGKIGVVEAKAVDWLQVKKWGEEPPLNYLLQPQTYCGLGKTEWCAIVGLVGGNELRKWDYDFRPALFAQIEARVVEFWQSVKAGKPPKPDYSRDGGTIAELIGTPDETVADLRRDNRAALLAADFLDAKQRIKGAEEDAEAAKAELMEKIGASGVAMLEGYRVGCAMTKGTPDKEITAAMVGETIKGRRGYRRFDIKETI